MKIITRGLVAAVCLLGFSGLLCAQENTNSTAETHPSDDDLRIRGVFDSTLPRTEKKNSLRFILHPHLGDLTKRDHLRTALGFRYGLTSRWEAQVESDAYFTHGVRHGGFFDESGFSSLGVGTKYRLGDPLRIGWDTSVGLDWRRPVGAPPPDVTDGLEHWTPALSFSRPWVGRPDWRVFFSLGADFVSATGVTGQLEKNELGDDAVSVSGGVLHTRGALTYTLETGYATTSVLGSTDRYVVSLRPGLVWVVPQKYTFGKNSKWLLGTALKLSHGSGGNDIGVSAKLRVNFDFKRLLGLKKAPKSGP